MHMAEKEGVERATGQYASAGCFLQLLRRRRQQSNTERTHLQEEVREVVDEEVVSE
jgi:hypothetical protein